MRASRGIIQPAIKVRRPEYLRRIYGAEYRRPEHLGRLRDRRTGHKPAMAAREFALRVDGHERLSGASRGVA